MTTRTLLRLLSVSLVTLAVIACGGDGSTDPTTRDQNLANITIPLRIHLIESTTSDSLNTTLTEAEVTILIEGVNEVWSQAAITWLVDTIFREFPQNEEIFEAVLAGQLQADALTAVVPGGNLFFGDWDVFMIRSFGGVAGGIYLPSIQSVIFPELDPTGLRDLTGSGRRILAHELGHSLSLQHVACPPEGNLMAPGCDAPDRTLLTAAQIAQVRQQAATGRPWGS